MHLHIVDRVKRFFVDRLYSWPTPSLEMMSLGPASVDHNPLMIQFFTWEAWRDDMSWWQHFHRQIPLLAELGVTQVWLPPPNKAMKKMGQGYDAYDLWDLGEFDQKGTVATRWGTKEDLIKACHIAKAHGMHVLIDAVMNHKIGADGVETFSAVPVHAKNRLSVKGKPQEIEGWTRYDFPGRQGKYSPMKWNHRHFTGVDWDQRTKTKGVFYIPDDNRKGWNPNVDDENGNYDYLLGCDIDHTQPDVKKDLLEWGNWVLQTTGAFGFRLDAIKHMDREFLLEFLEKTAKRMGRPDLFSVAEYWSAELSRIEPYIRTFEGRVAFFDVPLHYNLHNASKQGSVYDLRQIFHNTVVDRRPGDAVTFVDNHDTQVGQSLESWVDSTFKLQAYALVLLRSNGHPCVFYGDLYPNAECYNHTIGKMLELLIRIRKLHAYGSTADYFQYPNCIGWVRSGAGPEQPGIAVVIRSTTVKNPLQEGDYGESVKMKVPPFTPRRPGRVLCRDLLGDPRPVIVDSVGWGEFPCPRGGVTVWYPTTE